MGKILAVDFDGTITKKSRFPHKPSAEDISDRCVEVLQGLKKAGCTIILWTCREGKYKEDAVEYCREMGIPIDYVNENCDAIKEAFESCSPKIFANYYIDDMNIGGFIGWDAVEEIVTRDLVREMGGY